MTYVGLIYEKLYKYILFVYNVLFSDTMYFKVVFSQPFQIWHMPMVVSKVGLLHKVSSNILLFVILLSKAFIHRELSNWHSCCMLLLNFCSISKFSIFEVCQVFNEGYLNVPYKDLGICDAENACQYYEKMWRLVWKYFSLVML